MPSIESWLTSIQDALSCIESNVKRGKYSPARRRQIESELADIDSRLWEICERNGR